MKNLIHNILTLLILAYSPTIWAQYQLTYCPIYDVEGNIFPMSNMGGINNIQISNIDLNNDGEQDLIIYDKSNNRLIPVSKINNELVYQPEYAKHFPEDVSSWLLARDFDADGKTDLFYYTPGGIKVAKNTSTNGKIDFKTEVEIINSFREYPNSSYSSNIYVNSSDIPLIEDIDSDGDLDILTFTFTGNTIEFHKNLSIEKTGKAGLDFEVKNTCYAFVEDDESGQVFRLHISDCELQVKNPEKGYKHSGFTFSYQEIDGVRNLQVGELTSPFLVNLELGKSVNNADSALRQNKQYPSNNTPDNLLFTASFWGDFNLDGKNNLLIGNNALGSSNTKNVWLYNERQELLKQDFLQEESLDLGAYGDIALLNNGSKLIQYAWHIDKGSPENHFNFYNRVSDGTGINYLKKEHAVDTVFKGPLSITQYKEGNNNEIILRDANGFLIKIDIATLGKPINKYQADTLVLKDNNNFTAFKIGARDNILSIPKSGNEYLLIVGRQNGTVSFYTSTTNENTYELVGNNIGQINLRGSFGDKQITPLQFDLNTNSLLLISEDGILFEFELQSDYSSAANLVSEQNLKNSTGLYPRGIASDINIDGLIDIVLGNHGGGFQFYSTTALSVEDKSDKIETVNIYPNPSNAVFNIEINKHLKNIDVINSNGQFLFSTQEKVIDLSQYESGLYFIKLETENSTEIWQRILKK